MIKQNLSAWDRGKWTKRLKKVVEQSKKGPISDERYVEYCIIAQSLGYRLIVDAANYVEHQEGFSNLQVAKIVELPD